ncbi:MAG: hypothetical protein IKX18_03325 [Muribaculaceae bacterium]|nr:hypothetical protein [Muribaculaceae bacterium]MBR5685171.1 hypothetical protein [Muribaculaceae bacterium]
MMKKTLDIPDYSPEIGVLLKWENGAEIKVSTEHGEVLIEANADGLTSFANHLLNLAQTAVPSGTHIHLDEHNSLEDGSSPLIIEKL